MDRKDMARMGAKAKEAATTSPDDAIDAAVNNPNLTRLEKAKEASRAWGERSTIHGVPHIIESENGMITLMWLVIVLITMGGCIILCIVTFLQYLSHEKIVELDLVSSARTFPAITLCNNSPYVRSRVTNISEIKGLDMLYSMVASGEITA